MAKTAQDLVAEARAKIVEIDLVEARALMNRQAVFVDVREPPEWAGGTISGALTLPRGVLEFKIAETASLSDRSQPVVVYCQTGGRSALAAATLQEMGFTAVKSLAGGYALWAAEN